jgi:hypothetical protein
MDGNLTPHDVDTLLRELARRLHESDTTAGIRIVGGAAIALMNDQRRTTRDIDAALYPDLLTYPWVSFGRGGLGGGRRG